VWLWPHAAYKVRYLWGYLSNACRNATRLNPVSWIWQLIKRTCITLKLFDCWKVLTICGSIGYLEHRRINAANLHQPKYAHLSVDKVGQVWPRLRRSSLQAVVHSYQLQVFIRSNGFLKHQANIRKRRFVQHVVKIHIQCAKTIFYRL